jgi:TetR/AcrR family transcriptional regulator, repressor for neighboring sulfatase
VSAGPARRRRRSVDDARREILDAAERLLAERGPEAVRVQTVARAVGLTDAAVHYHFGNREGLLEALLHDVGRRMKAELAEADDHVGLDTLLDVLDETYRGQGYARLTAWMRLAGWKPTGEGMFRPYAEALHRDRIRRADAAGTPSPSLDDTLHLVTLLNLVSWADALTGEEWRRSVGLPATPEAREAFQRWLLDRLEDPPAPRH